MNKLERKAAMIVAAATAGVIVSGVKLMKKHTKYLAEKAAATFGPDDEEWTEPAAEDATEETVVEEAAEETAVEEAAEEMKADAGSAEK
ncbi:MAG: hypothetical protein IJ820_03000 [Lachnospiraceae bacterium]|nr:hypothetical protein [Lachnospiraceae bacterium]